jgi:chromate reductase
MTAPEAYIHITEGLITDDGTVTNDGTAEFLRTFMEAFLEHVTRVLTVVPQRK